MYRISFSIAPHLPHASSARQARSDADGELRGARAEGDDRAPDGEGRNAGLSGEAGGPADPGLGPDDEKHQTGSQQENRHGSGSPVEIGVTGGRVTESRPV